MTDVKSVCGLLERFEAAARRVVPAVPLANEVLARLPAPVQRYLRLALPVPTPPIRVARFAQAGVLRSDPASARWLPFQATHRVVPAASAFLWDARVRAAPLVRVRVLDALIDGRGSGWVGLLSRLTLSASIPSAEMDSGALHRFLAEAPWYPTALLPSVRLAWRGIDETRALATLSCGAVAVSLEFRFAADGTVSGIYTPARWGRFGKRYEQRAWEGHFAHYRRHDALLVPARGEVGWYSGGTWQAVWRGEMRAATYDRALP